MVFPVDMYGYESWTIKKAEHWKTDAFELWSWRRLLRVPWTARRSNQSILKQILKLKLQLFWPSDVKNWLIGKDPDSGKDWKQEEKRMTEDEMVGWHHWLDGHEFEQAPGVGDGQGSLACCSPWGYNKSDTTEWLNWTLGKGWRFPGIWPLPTPWSLDSALELSLEVPCNWVCHLACWLRIKI